MLTIIFLNTNKLLICMHEHWCEYICTWVQVSVDVRRWCWLTWRWNCSWFVQLHLIAEFMFLERAANTVSFGDIFFLFMSAKNTLRRANQSFKLHSLSSLRFICKWLLFLPHRCQEETHTGLSCIDQLLHFTEHSNHFHTVLCSFFRNP